RTSTPYLFYSTIPEAGGLLRIADEIGECVGLSNVLDVLELAFGPAYGRNMDAAISAMEQARDLFFLDGETENLTRRNLDLADGNLFAILIAFFRNLGKRGVESNDSRKMLSIRLEGSDLLASWPGGARTVGAT
ncbi:unnamed protein product, partial [Amoebophrya sp. A25]